MLLVPNGIARVLFVAKAGEMILLHGIIKKTNKLPPQEKELALKRLKLWESHYDKK
jgi:phage-related protein